MLESVKFILLETLSLFVVVLLSVAATADAALAYAAFFPVIALENVHSACATFAVQQAAIPETDDSAVSALYVAPDSVFANGCLR